MILTFAALHDGLSAAGLAIGVAWRDGRHAITVTDPAAPRSISLTVERDFDQAAQVLVMSMPPARVVGPMRGLGRVADDRSRELWEVARVPGAVAASMQARGLVVGEHRLEHAVDVACVQGAVLVAEQDNEPDLRA